MRSTPGIHQQQNFCSRRKPTADVANVLKVSVGVLNLLEGRSPTYGWCWSLKSFSLVKVEKFGLLWLLVIKHRRDLFINQDDPLRVVLGQPILIDKMLSSVKYFSMFPR